MLPITLNHKFKRTCHDIHGLLNGCTKISTFVRRLEQQSVSFPDRYEPAKYKGDGLELFVEALLKLSPIDCRLGIGQYQVNTELDTGVDGTGIGINEKIATVQVKFVGKSDHMLTTSNSTLSNFTTSSVLRYGVDPSVNTNMLVITTAKGLHHFTNDEMFVKKVRCVGYDQLRELVDNNTLFWNAFVNLCSS